MVFNDTTNLLGICQEIDSLCDTDTTSYPVAVKTRRANTALETLIGDIIGADGTWQFDDTNYTDLPIGTSNLTSGQSSYSISSALLEIVEVDVLNLSNIYVKVEPFDASEVGMSFEEYFNVTASTAPNGLPRYYDKLGNTIRFDASPTAATTTLTNGLKVKYKRTGSLFTASDTTKEPGIASPWHITIAKMAALPYCKTYKKDRVPQLQADIITERASLVKFYGRRERDKRKVMSNKPVSFR